MEANIFRFPVALSEKPLTLPESGMGYQRVMVRLKSGELIKDLLVFNAEDLEAPDDKKIEVSDIEKIIVEHGENDVER